MSTSALFIERIAPNYPENEPLVSLNFESEEAYDEWFTNIASRHAHWNKSKSSLHNLNAKAVEGIPKEALTKCELTKETLYIICDHARKRATRKVDPTTEATSSSSENTPPKKRRKTRASIKVNCPAKITKISLINGKVRVEYHWKHHNHNPLDTKEVISSRLPKVFKNWIDEQLQSKKDWKAIKATLRLSEKSLENYEMSEAVSRIPAGLLIKYSDVMNAIDAKKSKQPKENAIKSQDS